MPAEDFSRGVRHAGQTVETKMALMLAEALRQSKMPRRIRQAGQAAEVEFALIPAETFCRRVRKAGQTVETKTALMPAETFRRRVDVKRSELRPVVHAHSAITGYEYLSTQG